MTIIEYLGADTSLEWFTIYVEKDVSHRTIYGTLTKEGFLLCVTVIADATCRISVHSHSGIIYQDIIIKCVTGQDDRSELLKNVVDSLLYNITGGRELSAKSTLKWTSTAQVKRWVVENSGTFFAPQIY